jgi:putative transposase
LITIYGYAIMPNHIHLLWHIIALNGKESPSGSFSKCTAYQFKKYLSQNNLELLNPLISNKIDRKYHFLKRDPLSIPMSTETIF